MSSKKKKRISPKAGGNSNPFQPEAVDSEKDQGEIKIKYSYICKLTKVILIAIIFLLVNIGFGWLLRTITGSRLVAIAVPTAMYYILIRKLCIYIVFPGSFFGYKRRLEM